MNKDATENAADATNRTLVASQTKRAVAEEPATHGVITSSKGKKDKKRKSKDVRLADPESSKAVEQLQSLWKVSQPMGGRMANVDPVLTEDERYAHSTILLLLIG